MNEIIYEKDGIRIEEYTCYSKENFEVGNKCYQIEMEIDVNDRNRAVPRRRFTGEELRELVADLVELKIGREKSEKSKDKVKLIRRRDSYKRFACYAEELKTIIEVTNKQVEMLLDVYYHSMDEVHAYGSRRTADLAYESLQQVKEDLKEGVLPK